MGKFLSRKLNYTLRLFSRFRSSTEPHIITTPIFYVNAAPHLGHMYSAVIADASHRFQHLLGSKETIFSTGTDEHGLKIQQAAKLAGKDVKQFCDDVSSKFQTLFQMASVDYTRFIRTTDTDHINAVCHFWNTLMKTGNIYMGKYEGWYCTSEEAFLKDSQLKEITEKDGQTRKISIESGHPVEWITESNYMFRLSKYSDDLLHWLRGDVVYPTKFADILVKYCQEDVEDLSVSRAYSRLKWGIPVPDDDTQTIYVWMDALVNYLTVCGYPNKNFVWPPSVQIIGKDILKFHGVYWPALLIAAGLEPPRKLFCHSHWIVNNEKMSKSKGNVVDPVEKIQKFTCDAVRYFLLAEGVPHSDGNYSSEKFVAMVNAELADTFGNLLNRCTAKSLNRKQIFPWYNKDCLKDSHADSRDKLVNMVLSLPDKVQLHYQELNFDKGIEQIMSCLRQANRFMEECKPWELKKEPDSETLDSIIHVTMETLRICGILLLPITPKISTIMLDRLGISPDERDLLHIKPFLVHNGFEKNVYGGHRLGSNTTPLFQRIISNKD
ncbi:hypothetical protein CHUAL_001409 [Chamberlinius hualienensis]